MVLKWFYSLSCRKTFVGGKCALPSALLVASATVTIHSLDFPFSSEGLGKQTCCCVIISIGIKIKEGSFVGIVGQVGSGKSTLLSAMLGETEKLAGDVTVKVLGTRNSAVTFTL